MAAGEGSEGIGRSHHLGERPYKRPDRVIPDKAGNPHRPGPSDRPSAPLAQKLLDPLSSTFFSSPPAIPAKWDPRFFWAVANLPRGKPALARPDPTINCPLTSFLMGVEFS